MTADHFVDIEFVAVMNSLDWRTDGQDMFFKFNPDDITIFGRWAFGAGTSPAIDGILGGYIVWFCQKDISRLQQLGVRFPQHKESLTPQAATLSPC